LMFSRIDRNPRATASFRHRVTAVATDIADGIASRGSRVG
jgi:hypothetical protein